ncbi:hypothetical protein HDE69_005233 [Pedobacter cryoconitis]|uniref:Uncharacterized protein n=1 Tax=Pedobacter cryoconitis TaxID=188932 RepID=A0A7W8YYH4_9SPHI|nr:hypothetical protein [Pedobacter cryoconitis]MBB5624136.1 hypothetical protein [Pedobacter cryoconitis]
MIKTNTDVRLSTLIHKYDLHTILLSKVINRIETVDLSLLGNDAKKIPWLVNSQVQLRFEVANLLGVDEVQNADILFRFDKGIQFNMGYLSLDSFNLEWGKISSILRTEILELDNEDLFTYSEDDPEMKGTFFDLLSGIIEREASIISVLTILLV